MIPSGILRRFAGFSGLQLVSSLAPLALLPILARAAGVDGWASIVAGQAVGTFVASVSMWGWSVVGPAQVAGAPVDARWSHYRAALSSRLALLTIALPIGCAVSLLVAADGYVTITLLMVCAQAIGALSPSWYAIGIGQPRMILTYDAGPRLLGVLVAAVALLWGAPLITYPVIVLVTSLGGTVAATLRLRADARGAGPYTWSAIVRDCTDTLRSQMAAAGTQIAGATYGGATVAVVGVFATTAATAEFASADKLYRFSLMAVVAVGNTFQGWVAEHPFPASKRRMQLSLAALGGLGVMGGAALAVLGPWATGLLFGAELSASGATSAWYGLAFLGICLSTSLGRHVLVPLGYTHRLFLATVIGAVVGLPAMALLARSFGAAGGAAGYAASEVVGALVLGLMLVRGFPAPPPSPGPTETRTTS